MGENSNIEWTDHTFNPWIGCTKVSDECAHCYAETLMDHRLKAVKWGKGQPRKRTSEAYWAKVEGWQKNAKRFDLRPRVFCASLADWLDDEVPIEWLSDLLKLIEATPNLDWLLLTKRPENWRRRIRLATGEMAREWDCYANMPFGGKVPENVWIGTSVGNQKAADARIPQLLKIPAKIRFLSMEPLLGPVKLHNKTPCDSGCWMNHIDWVIVGGESGQGARPMNHQWVREIRDQCSTSAFFFKQWGGVNKKLTGRKLDGRTWDEFPWNSFPGGDHSHEGAKARRGQ